MLSRGTAWLCPCPLSQPVLPYPAVLCRCWCSRLGARASGGPFGAGAPPNPRYPSISHTHWPCSVAVGQVSRSMVLRAPCVCWLVPLSGA